MCVKFKTILTPLSTQTIACHLDNYPILYAKVRVELYVYVCEYIIACVCLSVCPVQVVTDLSNKEICFSPVLCYSLLKCIDSCVTRIVLSVNNKPYTFFHGFIIVVSLLVKVQLKHSSVHSPLIDCSDTFCQSRQIILEPPCFYLVFIYVDLDDNSKHFLPVDGVTRIEM